ARVALLPHDSDLLQSIKMTEAGCEIRMADKLAAIRLDNDLAGHNGGPDPDDEMTKLVMRVRIGGNESRD
ncbi:MAG: hypothetical protein ABIZ56_00645, partial [Chthoniobacteraceae bacterium]